MVLQPSVRVSLLSFLVHMPLQDPSPTPGSALIPTPPAPLSRRSQIRAAVMERIASGEWAPGARIPSEHQLMALFGVSRMTVHSALSELARDGMVRRIKGLGTFVSPPGAHLTMVPVTDPAADIRARGGDYAVEVILAMARRGTAAECQAFRLPEGATLFHLVALHREDAAPVVLEDRLVNPAVAPDFLGLDLTRTSAFDHLIALAPAPEGRHVIRAVEASERLRTLLALQPGEPCLEIERTTWTDSRIVTVVRLYHPGLRFELTGTIERR